MLVQPVDRGDTGQQRQQHEHGREVAALQTRTDREEHRGVGEVRDGQDHQRPQHERPPVRATPEKCGGAEQDCRLPR